MIWKDFSRTFKTGDHAFLSPSTYSWCNYNEEKLLRVYINKLAAARGTELHDLASKLIRLRQILPDEKETLCMYVNDAIRFRMRTEEKLFYSKFCYGTADAISFEEYYLRVHDLKSGKTKASFMQLRVYAALFFLCYPEIDLKDVKGVELRLYQNDNILVENPEPNDLVPIMDKIVRFSKKLQLMEDEFNDGIDACWSGS